MLRFELTTSFTKCFCWQNRPLLFFSKLVFPAVFNNETIQFYNNVLWKMPIQYPVLGFKPTTSWTLSHPLDQKTRPLLFNFCSYSNKFLKIKRSKWLSRDSNLASWNREKCDNCGPPKLPLVVALLAERFLPSPEDSGSNPAVCNI